MPYDPTARGAESPSHRLSVNRPSTGSAPPYADAAHPSPVVSQTVVDFAASSTTVGTSAEQHASPYGAYEPTVITNVYTSPAQTVVHSQAQPLVVVVVVTSQGHGMLVRIAVTSS